jgi:integrase
MGSSRASSTWASVLRSGLRLSLAQRGTSSGWRVSDFRGRTRLTVDGRTGRHQVLLPIEWSHEQADAIRDAVLAIHDAYLAGSTLDQAIDAALAGDEQAGDSGTRPIDWPALVERFKAKKLSSGAIKPQTWSSVYQRRMAELLATFKGKRPPTNPRELLEAVTARWSKQPGSRGRQMQVQQTAALLRWGVDSGTLAPEWAPPLDLDPYVGRKRSARTITTPLEVQHILELVDAIPDTRWRFAFQLLAAYGLRPEELQHLQIRRDRLWCNYRKCTSRGETQPRPLRLLPCDDWAEGWNLLETFKSQPLPPMRPGYGAEDMGLYMRRRPRWQELRQDYEAAGEKLVLYSARHGYAHRAHMICELPPKVAAAAMGHSVETHLSSYSKWCGDDVVDDAFERAAKRLGR